MEDRFMKYTFYNVFTFIHLLIFTLVCDWVNEVLKAVFGASSGGDKERLVDAESGQSDGCGETSV